MAKEDINKKVQDGKLEKVMTKKEREEAAKIQVGGDKKPKGKKYKVKGTKDEEEKE
jgi:hypothetical protein